MFIAINGQLGSGKSEVCKILNRDYGYDVFSTGVIQREFANQLGISTLELNKLAKENFSYDYKIDTKLVEYSTENMGKNVVFDSRTAWHFVKGSFKVHLLVCPAIAAERVFNKRETKEEKYSSVEEAMRDLIERRRLEVARYKKIYNLEVEDFSNYNLILDTSTLTPKEVCEIIIQESNEYRKNPLNHRIIVSKKTIYPTKKLENLNEKSIDKYKKLLKSKSKNKMEPIRLSLKDDILYIKDGHNRAVSLNANNEKVYDAVMVPNSVGVLSYNSHEIVILNDYSFWEEINKFKYSFYPTQK